MSFLTGLGAFAGGLAPGLEQYAAQQRQNATDTAVGESIYAMAGMTPPQAPQFGQGQQGGLGSILGSLTAPFSALGGGPSANQAPPLAALSGGQSPPVSIPPVSQPSFQAPLGRQSGPSPLLAQGSSFSPQAAPQAPQNAPLTLPGAVQTPPPPATFSGGQTPPPLAPGAPTTAQPGSQTPGQSQSAGAGPPYSTQAQLQQPQNRQQPDQPQGPDLSKYNNMFDMNTLIRALANNPGMTPLKIGRIVRSEGFRNMLTQEGLNQYRAANLDVHRENAEIARERLSQQADEFAKREARLTKQRQDLSAYRAKAAQFAPIQRAIFQSAAQKAAAINNNFDLSPEEKQKQLKAVEDERDKQLAEAQKKYLPEPPSEEGGGPSQRGPQPGEIYRSRTGDTYRFKGGDWNDKANFDLVQ